MGLGLGLGLELGLGLGSRSRVRFGGGGLGWALESMLGSTIVLGCKVDKVGRRKEKTFSSAFGATICMANSCWPLATKWARRAGVGDSRTKNEETFDLW